MPEGAKLGEEPPSSTEGRLLGSLVFSEGQLTIAPLFVRREAGSQSSGARRAPWATAVVREQVYETGERRLEEGLT